MARVPKVYCFPDTNIFIHCKDFQDVDWPRFLGATEVILVVTSPVLRELEKHKNDRTSDRRRTRSRLMLNTIESLTATGSQDDSYMVRQGTRLRLELLVNVERSSPELDPRLEDDRILAHVLAFKDEHPGNSPVLLSDDLGLRLKARALGIEAKKAPVAIRLPDEPTEAEEETRRLHREVDNLKRAAPVLYLKVEAGRNVVGDEIPFKLTTSLDSDEAIAEQVEERRRRLMAPKLIALAQMGGGRQKQEQYEDAVEEFVSSFREHLEAHSQWRYTMANSLPIAITVENRGRAIADPVVVEIVFPKGYQVHEEGSLPEEPKCPREPNSPGVFGLSTMDLSGILAPPAINAQPLRFWDIDESDKGIIARRNVGRVVHNVPKRLETLLVCPPPENGAGVVLYRVHAGNLPEPIEGSLVARMV